MPGSATTPGRTGARASVPVRFAFHRGQGVGARVNGSFAAQCLAYALPCRRFAPTLTDGQTHGSGPMWIATPSP